MTGGPIDDYLDDLVRTMSTRHPRALRNLLAETEAHLRDTADALVASGLSPEQAEREAVARFGPSSDLVAAERRRLTTPLRTLARQSMLTALLLGGIAAVTVGLSGLVNWAIYGVAGPNAVVDVAPGRTLSASDCARWLALTPSAPDCRAAAINDWIGEVILYRVALGVLGAIALAAWFAIRRSVGRHDRARAAMLPATVSDTIATTLFAAAALFTLGSGVDLVFIAHGRGSGQWLSAAAVSLAATGVFGVRLIRDLRNAAAA